MLSLSAERFASISFAELVKTDCIVIGTVTDGQQALEAARELMPEVLVLDISMPVMSGIETAHQLKKAGSDVRMVFLTVHGDPEFAREALEAGALGYVIKPRIASDLVTAIKEAHAGGYSFRPRSPRCDSVERFVEVTRHGFWF